MIIYYHPNYNINLGLLNYLHIFDGSKYKKVFDEISKLQGINIRSVQNSASQDIINSFAGELLKRLFSSKRYIPQALEVPYIPLLPFSVIDNRILSPMRWAVSGTLEAAQIALTGQNTWNLSGGYHHASKHACF